MRDNPSTGSCPFFSFSRAVDAGVRNDAQRMSAKWEQGGRTYSQTTTTTTDETARYIADSIIWTCKAAGNNHNSNTRRSSPLHRPLPPLGWKRSDQNATEQLHPAPNRFSLQRPAPDFPGRMYHLLQAGHLLPMDRFPLHNPGFKRRLAPRSRQNGRCIHALDPHNCRNRGAKQRVRVFAQEASGWFCSDSNSGASSSSAAARQRYAR